MKKIVLEEIINLESFQKIQDDIAIATDVAIVMVDYKGKPITKHSNCTAFCSRMRSMRKYSTLCEKCDSRGGIESVRTKEIYIYKCHKGIVDFAVPIIVKNQYLGAIMAGQILMKDSGDIQLEEIVSISRDYDELPKCVQDEINNEYSNLPVVSYEKIKSIARTMFHICNYIVEEAILKMELKNTEYNEESMKHELLETNNVSLLIDEQELPVTKAIKHINNNITRNITLESISSTCNLSPSYFSKVFKRETGVTFIQYLNTKKISKAKQMIIETDETISSIACNLGFEDCGYFIKIFKKLEGVTPKKFRDSQGIKDSSI